MDSEHRHELNENALLSFLQGVYDRWWPRVAPLVPGIGFGLTVLVIGAIAYSSYRSSSEEARADQWRAYTIAVEGQQPNLALLRQAADTNPDTPVEEWSEATWADGRLYEATQQFLRNRDAAQQAIDDATAVYQRLVVSPNAEIADRAAYQLGRAFELQGDLEAALAQYARVGGAFMEAAAGRSAALESERVAESIRWIAATQATAPPAEPPSDADDLTTDDPQPDPLPLPVVTPEEAEAALESLLEGADEIGSVLGEATPAEDADDTGPAAEKEADDSPAALDDE